MIPITTGIKGKFGRSKEIKNYSQKAFDQRLMFTRHREIQRPALYRNRTQYDLACQSLPEHSNESTRNDQFIMVFSETLNYCIICIEISICFCKKRCCCVSSYSGCFGRQQIIKVLQGYQVVPFSSYWSIDSRLFCNNLNLIVDLRTSYRWSSNVVVAKDNQSFHKKCVTLIVKTSAAAPFL